MPPEAIFDHTTLDLNKVVISQEETRKSNPQRFEMEHLDGILMIDPENHIIVGFKDVRSDEFWVRGHMPGYPILPGVIMCESAAQLCSYYVVNKGFLNGDFIGFLGLENVRFRSVVKPGDKLVLVGKSIKLNRRQTIFSVQGFVGSTMVFHCEVIGGPLSMNPAT